jgi:hypothetical protein
MKTIPSYFALIIFCGTFLFSPVSAPAEDKTPAPKESSRTKTANVRETEILGTLEKPQFSTELPWQSPAGYSLNAPQLHRSFKKEIFRPLHPLSELNKKPE